MKFRKITVAIAAVAMAVSALSVGAYADDEKINLITAEIPEELKTSMVYFDGVGVVDINGAKYDSSENISADENANLDVDFDGLGYVSEKNIEAWRDTGVLTFGKLKTDFDTTGIQWGMFQAKNNYVQLVKRDDGGEVTERGLYNITDGELKKLDDLDTFWTATCDDGTSIGMEFVKQMVHVHTSFSYSDETYEDDFDREIIVELNITVTQPDGTKTTETIAKIDLPNTDINISNGDFSGLDFTYIDNCIWSVPSDSSKPISVAVGYANAMNLYELSGGFTVEVWQYYPDRFKEGTNVFETKGVLSRFHGQDGNFMLGVSTPPLGGFAELCTYESLTEKVDSISRGSFNEATDREVLNKIFFDTECKYLGDRVVCKLGDGNYYIFNDLQDMVNLSSKTAYKSIQTNMVDDTPIFMFEDLDGKKGYMDGDGNVLAYFDNTDGFGGKYAPVVKDGKAFLVDKNMKTVSEEIDADSVVAVSDDIFIVSKGDKSYFVTYIAEEIDNPASGAVLVDYSDDASGFKASAEEGVLADGAKLTVTAVEDKTDENKFTYNITFKVDDKEVQPNGKVTVKIPVPEAFAGKTIYVYRAEEDGTYTNMKAEVEDGYVVFDTDHFSIYVVTVEDLENESVTPGGSDSTDNSNGDNGNGSGDASGDGNTGSGNDQAATGITLAIAPAVLAASAAIVIFKKRK